MKKTIWLAAGIAGMFLGNPIADAQVGVSNPMVFGYRPSFVIDTRPSFIYLQDKGFSVSYGSPYDIIYYGDIYYLYNNGGWYRASNYRGPWIGIREYNLPPRLRRHRWDDLRRYRDIEYRRHDRMYWEDRDRRDRDLYDRGRHDGGDRGGRGGHDGGDRGGRGDHGGGDRGGRDR